MKIFRFMMLSVLLPLICSCDREAGPSGSGAGVEGELEVLAAKEPVADHLGFATRVPADCDLYFSAFYGEDEMFDSIEKAMLGSGVFDLSEGDEEAGDRRAELEEISAYVGSEFFVFVGEGAGDQLEMVGTMYRELSAAWAGFGLETILGIFEDDENMPDLGGLGKLLGDRLDGDWMAAIENDSRLRVPSVVAGWKPGEEKVDECLEAVEQQLMSVFQETEHAKRVEFERHGVALSGYEVKGVDIFKELIDSMGEAIKKEANFEEFDSRERLERLMVALKNVKFTIATGVCEGRVLVYFGDGEQGFRLADDAEQSLAGSEELRWMEESPGRSIRCAAYFSESMVGAVLPWLDTSSYWEAVAGAVGPPLRKVELFRELFFGLAGVAQELGKRNISAWSVFAYSDPDWVVETRGGMVDRSIDYEAPLTMNDAARAAEPAFRAHWVQNSDWENLSWSKMEHFGALLELGLSEWKDRQSEEEISIVPEGFSEKLVTEVIALNRMYRDEFREGIGDEVAWFGDFLGEMPAVPGISEETIQGQTIPRFLIARPLESREKITAAGESLSASNRRVSKWLSESIEIEIPAVMPQSIESGGVMTWFAPLPFIGGDFVPGVSIDDRVWMIGTSRSLAEGFSKSMETGGSAGETGVIFEVDLERLVSWSEEIRVANEETIDSLTDELLEETEVPEGFGSSEGLIEGLKKLKRFSYRSWLEGGKPRSRYKLEFKSSE